MTYCKLPSHCGLRYSYCLLLIVLVGGCGKSGEQVAPVSGRVTLDGQPLGTADILFQPGDMKPPSSGRTDKDGRYTLGYKRGVPGALVGQHLVRIAVNTDITHGPQTVPPRYNTQSELKREVELGKQNVIDFELTSDKK